MVNACFVPGIFMLIFKVEKIEYAESSEGGNTMTDLLIYFVVGVVIPGLLVAGIAVRELYLHHHDSHHHRPHPA
jgi:hypothetical protein